MKLLLLMLAFYIRALVGVLDALLPGQLPDNAAEKAVEDGSNTWAPAIHVGDLDATLA